MKSMEISRRQFLKTTGALVVSFSLCSPARKVRAQFATLPSGDIDPTSLDSWLAITADGMVTFYTSKVELGTGTITALAQIVAEELDVPFHKVQMDSGDTSRTIEQGSTVGSRTIERAGPQIRQAAAAARQELLKLAAARLNAPIEKLTVVQGIVSVAGDSSKKISYGELIGGKKFNTKITATGTGWDMKVAPEVKAKNPKDYKGVGKEIKRTDLPTKVTGEHDFIHRENLSAWLRKPNGLRSKPRKRSRLLGHNRRRKCRRPPMESTNIYGAANRCAAKRQWIRRRGGRLQSRQNLPSQLSLAFQMHGMIGPSCSIADVRGDKATIWSGPQGPFRTRGTIARLLNIPEQNVGVIYQRPPAPMAA